VCVSPHMLRSLSHTRGTPCTHVLACPSVLRAISLLSHTCPPTPRQEDWTALHAAADKGHLEVVKVLLASGAVVNAKGKVCWWHLFFPLVCPLLTLVVIALAAWTHCFACGF